MGVDRTGVSHFDVLLSPGLLVAEFPTVLDLRQELASSFDIALAPGVHAKAAELEHLRGRELLQNDVASQSGDAQSEFFGGGTGRKAIHYETSVLDSLQGVKPNLRKGKWFG